MHDGPANRIVHNRAGIARLSFVGLAGGHFRHAAYYGNPCANDTLSVRLSALPDNFLWSLAGGFLLSLPMRNHPCGMVAAN